MVNSCSLYAISRKRMHTNMKGALMTNLVILLTINISCTMGIGDIMDYQMRYRWQMYRQRNIYVCPPAISNNVPDLSLSPFDDSSSLHKGDMPQSYVSMAPTRIIPLSTKAFRNLGIAVLPNRQICVHGMKIANIMLPENPRTHFGIMTGIAIWFSPCIPAASKMKKKRCFKSQMMRLNKLDMMQVSSLHELVMKFLSL